MATLALFFQHLPWVTIFGLLGDTISFLVFLSPIPTFYRIYKKKSTEGFQSLPYVLGLFSCMLLLFYAYVKTNMIFLIIINAFGLFIEVVYLTIYLIYGTKEAKILTLKLITLLNVFGFGVIIFFTLVIAKTTPARILILGWVNLIFSLCVFAAPLGVMRQVIKTKSVKYMPFLLSFFLTISAVVWFFYGLLKKDMYVAVPNVLGFSFGILQMVLYAIYRNAKPVEEVTEAGKNKDFSSDQIIVETVKNTQQQPKNGGDDGVFAIEIPNLNMEPMKKMGMNNHAPSQIAVAV